VNVTGSSVNMLTIIGAVGTDPIRVITENYGPGKGRIIIQCWDRAWCGAWFAMSGKSIEAFFAEAGWDYILGNLTCGLHGMRKDAKKSDEPWLRRIIEAVQVAFREQLAAQAPARDPRVPDMFEVPT
jgi:hypothetical protein